MITAISSVKQTNTSTGLKKTNRIAFKGSPLNLIKNESKVSRFAEETVSSVGRCFRKLFGNSELPFSEKPLTANAKIKHILPDGMTTMDIDVPEISTETTKVLDGSNILVPDDALDAASTKAALTNVISGKSDAVDAVTSGLDAVSAKADIAGAIADGADALSAKADVADAITTTVEHKSVLADLLAHLLDKI